MWFWWAKDLFFRIAGNHFLVETEDTAESDERGSAGSNDYAHEKSKKYKKRTKGNLYDIDSDIFHHYRRLHISALAGLSWNNIYTSLDHQYIRDVVSYWNRTSVLSDLNEKSCGPFTRDDQLGPFFVVSVLLVLTFKNFCPAKNGCFYSFNFLLVQCYGKDAAGSVQGNKWSKWGGDPGRQGGKKQKWIYFRFKQ